MTASVIKWILYIIISPSLIANISNVNSELDIPSDHCTMTVILTSEKLRSEDRNISLKLYNKTDWSKINESIKNKLNRNAYLPEYIWQKVKNKRSLRTLYVQTKDQSIKPTLNLIKKEIKKRYE